MPLMVLCPVVLGASVSLNTHLSEGGGLAEGEDQVELQKRIKSAENSKCPKRSQKYPHLLWHFCPVIHRYHLKHARQRKKAVDL